MAVTNGWGQATQNNTNGFGKYENTIDAGSVYAVSYAGETALSASGGESFTNTKSIEFDGVDDRISISEIQFTGEFTLSMWVNPAAITGSTTFILGRWDNNFDNDIQVNNESDGSSTIRLRIGGTTLTFYGFTTNPDGVIPLNTWSNIIFTRDGSNLITCFVNSIQFSTSTYTNTNTLTLGSIGRVINNSYGWNGKLDEISFFNTGLSSSDVSAIYNSGTPTDLLTYSSLIHWWRMGDGDTFPTITDNKGSNNGTMLNMASDDIVENVP